MVKNVELINLLIYCDLIKMEKVEDESTRIYGSKEYAAICNGKFINVVNIFSSMRAFSDEMIYNDWHRVNECFGTPKNWKKI